MLWKLIRIFLSVLFTSYFDAVQTISVTTRQPTVVVNVGQNATLYCSYRTYVGSMFSLEWRFTAGPTANAKAEKILYYIDGSSYKPGPQANRIHLIDPHPTNGDASIEIESTKASDTGRYSCDINNPPDFTGPSEAFINLIVQVPPSTPECKVIGKPYIGNNVTLLCNSKVGWPAPQYIWSEVNSDTVTSSPRPMVKVMLFGQPNVKPPSVIAAPVTPSSTDSKKGTLFLRNLTMAYTGTYRCLASNVLGEQSCQLVLTVTVNNEAGVIVGAVFGTLVGLILIAAVTYHLLRHKQKNPKVPPLGNELREDALAPGKEANSHLLASSARSQEANSNSMNSKYNIVV